MLVKETLSQDITTYESVKNQTTEEYFEGNQFSIDVFNKKYIAFEGETYVQAIKRVCDYIASAEKTKEEKEYWSARWFHEIYNDWWHPAGSIMQGAGSGLGISLANCTTISLGALDTHLEWDNLESIIRNNAYTVAKCAAYRQGLGVEFSRLRPRGMKVLNSSKVSTGSIHWMKFIDSIGYFVGQHGRIPAMLFSLNGKHPDIEEFISVKSDYTKIQNANISVQLNDDFYEAVRKDEEYELKFEIPEVKKGEKVYVDANSADLNCKFDKEKGKWYYVARKNRPAETFKKKVKARELLKQIAQNMYNNAEPGIQNIDIARRLSNSDYVYDPKDEYDSRIISTNACSEQYLSRDSLCVLASINAGKFSTNPEELENEMEVIGFSVNRFLDNVNEMELKDGTYATYYQKLAIEKLRRTGAGITNIGAWLFKQNLEYGTKEANNKVENFSERYNYYLYKSSIELGKQKGSFGLFNREKLEKSPFIQRMMELGLQFDALRNVTCSSIAPTGSLSLCFRGLVMSYGIEPSFGIYYWKRTRITGKYEYYFCVPRVVREYFAANGYEIPMKSDTIKDTWDGKYGKPIAEFIENTKEKLAIHFKNATEVSPFDKLDMMAKVMKWVDSSISVTYMLPLGTNWKDVYDFILLAHEKGVKSIAAFPDKKMYGIVSYSSFKDLAFSLQKENIAIHKQNFTEEELKELNSSMLQNEVVQPVCGQPIISERPNPLPCDVFHIKVTKKLDKVRTFDYLVVIGLFNDRPYEVFALENGKLSKSYTKGKILKTKQGKYDLVFDDGVTVPDITKDTTDGEDSLTRMASMALRYGVEVNPIVDQLEKVEGDMMCFSKAIVRALKKYIKDGTKTSQKCPTCGNVLVRHEGCASCSCGYSKCS